MSARAPMRAVRDVREVEGPRGGTIHVLTLSCGCFTTRRLKGPPPSEVPCIACFVAPAREPLPFFRAVRQAVTIHGHVALIVADEETDVADRYNVLEVDLASHVVRVTGRGLPLVLARKVARRKDDRR